MAMRILISDKMSPEGLAHFTGHTGFEMVYNPEITMEELAETIGEFDALVIRSRTQVTAAILAKPGKLKVIGRAGAGVDNVDLDSATARGIIVMNTPGGNTISTGEHAISMLFALARRIPFADKTMHEGKWEKKSIVGVEMFGKTLGVIGLGKIGREVAARMQAFGMDILGYDPFLTTETAEKLGIELADIDTICERADMITIHCPLNSETRDLINEERLGKMKPSMLLVNCARGGIVDEEALCAALSSKKIAGAALDVFSTEPLPADHALRGLENIVLTPHLAASTNEAQEKVARAIAIQIREALSGEMIRNAVNAPSVDAKTYAKMKPVLDLCERMGRFASQFAKQSATTNIDVIYSGTATEHPQAPLTTALVQGFLECNLSETVNQVNAMMLAKNQGIKISETRSEESDDVYSGLITVKTTRESGETTEVSGTLFQSRFPRLVSVNKRRIDAIPDGQMLVLENRDVPGIIGSVGTCLGKHGINIAAMNWGRLKEGGDAMTVLNMDQPIPADVLKELLGLPNVLSAANIVI